MLVGDIARCASTMRTALIGRAMVRFDAPMLIGPVPQAGRMVEMIEPNGKHLEVMWDDGIVLDTHLKGRSEWHVYRQGAPWRRSWDQLVASIQTDDFVAVCFDAPTSRPTVNPTAVATPATGAWALTSPDPTSTRAKRSISCCRTRIQVPDCAT